MNLGPSFPAGVHSPSGRIAILICGLFAAWCALVAIVGVAILTRGIDADWFGPTGVDEIHTTMLLHGLAATVAAVVALFLRNRRSGVRAARVCLASVVLLSFISVDRILGCLFPPPTLLDSVVAPHERRGWYYRPNAVGVGFGRQVRTNRYGFRGTDISSQKPQDEQRVLVLGDSVTFGYLLPDDQTVPVLLEAAFSRYASGSRVRCINGGIAGYSTWQELDVLKAEGMQTNPDLVILQYSFNDVTDLVHLAPGDVPRWISRLEITNSASPSGLVRAIRTIGRRREWKDQTGGIHWAAPRGAFPTGTQLADFEWTFVEPPIPQLAKAWERALKSLDAFDEACRSRQLPWMLVLFPTTAQFRTDVVEPRPQDRLHRWADEHRVPFLDLQPIYMKRITSEFKGRSNGLMLDDIHPNPAGARLMAHSIAEFVEERHLLPSTAPAGER